ncbi:hypothetical protein EJB05_43002, partial [Eragrostis curvula]
MIGYESRCFHKDEAVAAMFSQSDELNLIIAFCSNKSYGANAGKGAIEHGSSGTTNPQKNSETLQGVKIDDDLKEKIVQGCRCDFLKKMQQSGILPRRLSLNNNSEQHKKLLRVSSLRTVFDLSY